MLALALAVVLALGAVGAMAPTNAAAPAAADLECFGVTATIVGTPGDDVIRGTNGPDVIVAGRGDDRINGRGGDDLICGRSGDDKIRGGNGDDRVLGWRGDDLILGGSGNDRLLGGLQADKILGGSGDDVLNGGAATDECDGGPGVNHLIECEVTPNEAPTDLTLAPTAVSENQPAGTVVGTLSAVDPDAGDTHAFTLVTGTGASDNSSFSISGSSLRTAAVLDYETTPTRSIRVRATDAGGLFVEKQLTITVTDVDDPPVAVDDTKTVAEDAAGDGDRRPGQRHRHRRRSEEHRVGDPADARHRGHHRWRHRPDLRARRELLQHPGPADRRLHLHPRRRRRSAR